MSPSKSAPKLNHEKILRLLQSNVQTILNSYEEPLAIAINVTWQSELGDDLPFGMLLVKEELSPELLNRCLKQNVKMMEYIVSGLRRQISELENLVIQMDAQIEKKHAQVQSTPKESDHGKETVRPADTGPFAPGTK